MFCFNIRIFRLSQNEIVYKIYPMKRFVCRISLPNSCFYSMTQDTDSSENQFISRMLLQESKREATIASENKFKENENVCSGAVI